MLRGMTRFLLILAIGLVGLLADAAPAAAQSDILLQLRSGSPAGDRFRVDSAGGFVALGQIGYGIIPASGSGWRMMWHPQKVAFRAGYADAGNQFDESNIGYFSWAGGALNIAQGIYSFAMGNQNTIVDGGNAGIALGANNYVSGAYSAAIGYDNTADANYSITLGYRASANGYAGTMVMSDQSTGDSLEASAVNRFHARYANGYYLYTNASESAGAYMLAGASSWSMVSDRNRKYDFMGIDGEELLARLEDVPVSSWRYLAEDDPSVRHIGPMAQDWQAAFGLSPDTMGINTGDFDGVNLAAIQALRVRTDALRADVAARDERIATLEERVGDLEARNAALEARLQRIEAALGTAE